MVPHGNTGGKAGEGPKYGFTRTAQNATIRHVTGFHPSPTGQSGPGTISAASSERVTGFRAAVQISAQNEDPPTMAAMAMNELGPMLTASEVAELLHLHVNTVKRLGDRGELPFYRVCKRGDRRFRLDDVMAFLARNR